MSKSNYWVLAAAISMIVVVSIVLLKYWPHADAGSSISGALSLSIVTLGGLALVVTLMAGLAAVFSALDMSNKAFALGLPEGSVRALIAFSLVLAFVCMSSFLYSSTSTPETVQLGKSLRISSEQLKELKENFTVVYDQSKKADGSLDEGEDGKTPFFDATYFSKRDKTANDFAKQIFTTLATVFVSVVSFYFGSSSILAATKRDQRDQDQEDQGADKTPPGSGGSGDNTAGRDDANTNRSAEETGDISASNLLQPASFVEAAVLPKFDQDVVEACAALEIASASDLSTIFGDPSKFFIWYNNTFRGVPEMQSRYPCSDSDLKRKRFVDFWNQVPTAFGTASISAIEFSALMAVNLEESSGNMSAAPEQMNKNTAKYHPGLAYAFDRIPNAKQSYNLGQNRSALSLFKDPLFVKAHGTRGGAKAVLQRTGGIDPAWGGDTWPSGVRADVDESMSGFIMQADFYKFRGRGIIQTTWRPDYKLMIDWILTDEVASNQILSGLADKWKAATPGLSGDNRLEAIATISSNEDWDAAFGETITLAKGVQIDSKAKNQYLSSLSKDANTLQGGRRSRGSFLYFAAHINGGDYPDRVAPKMEALLRGIAESVGATTVARNSRNPDIIAA